MNHIYSYTEAKTVVEDHTEITFYFFKIPIQIGLEKMYRVQTNNDDIDLDPNFMDEIRKNEWLPEQTYSIVSFDNKDLTVHYN